MPFLLAPIVGGYNAFARTQSMKHAKSKGEDISAGYILEGFHSYGLTATAVDAAELLKIVQHCQNELDTSKPKMMPGAYTPLMVLELIALGIDMFDTSYAYNAAVNFKAITFQHELPQDAKPSTEIPFLDLTDEK